MMNIITYSTEINEDNGVSLVKEKSIPYRLNATDFSSPQSIYFLMTDVFHLHKKAEEYVYLITIRSNNLNGVFQVFKGTIDEAHFNAREILTRSLLAGANQIIVVHNHPSGDPLPSSVDIKSTKRLKDAAKMCGIELLDHIIIGNGRYKSFNEYNML